MVKKQESIAFYFFTYIFCLFFFNLLPDLNYAYCFAEDVPEPVTESIVESSQAAVTDQTSASNNTVKSLQNELLGYQLMVEKLKRRNQVQYD